MKNQTAIPRIRFMEKFGFGTFSAASNIVFNFKDLFYLFFLTNVMGISIAHAGIITALGMVWDAVNDPLVGYWAVNHRFKNGEQCRPFALWCAVPWAITTVLMFTCFDVAYAMKLALAMVIYFLFELFNTFAAIPYNSMGSLATNLDSDRRSINVARNLGGCVGSGIGGVALYPLLDLFGGLDATGNIIDGDPGKNAFFYAAIVMGVLSIVGSLVHYFTTRERITEDPEKVEKLSVAEVAKMLFGCRSWVLNMLYIICYGSLNLLIMSTINYYCTYVLGSSAAATPLMAMYLVASVGFTFLSIPIDKKLGRRKTMISTAVVYILGKIWFVCDPYSMWAMYVNGASVAYAMSLSFVLFNTNRNNIADLIEWRSGRRIDSLVSTGDNLAAKLTKAGTNLLMTGALAKAGFDAELAAQPQAALDTICGLLGWAPALLAVIMLVVLWFHPIEKEMADMNKAKAEVK